MLLCKNQQYRYRLIFEHVLISYTLAWHITLQTTIGNVQKSAKHQYSQETGDKSLLLMFLTVHCRDCCSLFWGRLFPLSRILQDFACKLLPACVCPPAVLWHALDRWRWLGTIQFSNTFWRFRFSPWINTYFF